MVQRVSRASVTVDGELVATIPAGLLIYLGIAPSDTPEVARHLAGRLARMRVFPDAEGRMNRSLEEVGGAALVVSQFTLFADNRRGHRPAFTGAAPPAQGRLLCHSLAEELVRLGIDEVREGRFGAHMSVEAVNDGPVTIVATSAEDPWPSDCG